MEWLIYLLKVSTCMGLFYTLYHQLLQKLTFFSFNRFYLLATLVISFLIPVLQLQLRSDRPAPLTEKAQVITPAAVVPQGNFKAFQTHTETFQSASKVQNTDWTDVLGKCYWAITSTIFIVLLVQIATLLWHSRKVVRIVGRLRIVQKTGGFTNCSFLYYVFIDQQKLDKEALAAIMHHEGVHAAYYHSLDKMLIGICKALLWFSPPVYFYAKALEQVHEYEADRETSSVIGSTVYANLLLSLAVNTSGSSTPLVHSFVKNPVKERIKMLFTNPSKNMKKLTYLTLVPAGLALVALFGVQVVYAESKINFTNPFKDQRRVEERALLPVTAKTAEGKVLPGKKQALPKTEETPESPLRLIDNMFLGEDPAVFIDGKKYPAEILTRISPACMKSAVMSLNKAEIFTRNNQIEYATKAEIETAKIRRRMKAQARFYNRYPVTLYGRKQDEILVRFGSSFTQASFPKGCRIALSIDGKIFSEKQAEKMSGNYAYNMTGVKYAYTEDDPELFRKYRDQYDLILQFRNRDADSTAQSATVTRGSAINISEGYAGKFEYSAKDSTLYSADKRFITLFGNAKIINGDRSTLSGDKIKFDAKTRTATVQNASFIFEGTKKAVEAAFLKVDIDKGIYKRLSEITDF
jgi:hypothetical protein